MIKLDLFRILLLLLFLLQLMIARLERSYPILYVGKAPFKFIMSVL